MDMRLDQLSTYGIMSDYSASSVQQMIDTMIASGDIGVKPFKEYSELILNQQSASIIRKEKRVEMQVSKKEKEYASYDNVSADEEAMFQQLRKLREKLAMKEHVPPYMIFSNAALRDMCRRKPKNIHEFMEVSGVGTMRADKYGKAFLKEIAKLEQHLTKHA